MLRTTVLWALLSLASPAFAEQVSIDFNNPIRPFTHAGSGFLHSMSATSPPDSLLVPLRPQLLRAEPGPSSNLFPTYNRAQSLGADYQLVVSDAYNYEGALPGDGGDWSSWEALCRNFATQALGRQVHFDVWNEPDIDYFWSRSKSQWLETWRRGVQAIRSVNPAATIVGPSLAFYENGFLPMREFLDFARANNVLPDVISWHAFGVDINAEVADLRTRTDITRFSLNEIVAPFEAFRPGVLPRYFSQIESSRVESAALACWGTCFDNSLDGLLVGLQPTTSWHIYAAYGKMQGTSVATAGGVSLAAVATFDTATAHVLAGRYATSTSLAELALNNLDHVSYLVQAGKVHVRAERITSGGPVSTIDADMLVSGGSLLLTLPDLSDAYLVTLTSPLPGDYNANGAVDAADYVVWRERGGEGYVTWQSSFGRRLMKDIEVPEPNATLLLVLVFACRRRGVATHPDC